MNREQMEQIRQLVAQQQSQMGELLGWKANFMLWCATWQSTVIVFGVPMMVVLLLVITIRLKMINDDLIQQTGQIANDIRRK